MARKRHTPEQVIHKPGEAEAATAAGSTVAEAARRPGVTGQTFYRWRSDCGGPRIDQARRLQRLESQNSRLKRAAADLTLDNQMLREASEGNSWGTANLSSTASSPEEEETQVPRASPPDPDNPLTETGSGLQKSTHVAGRQFYGKGWLAMGPQLQTSSTRAPYSASVSPQSSTRQGGYEIARKFDLRSPYGTSTIRLRY